ncbi:hemerythrin domain-containing protein [Alkaliphilus peptidifermentans]|uniref:Hemerythrin-like domain-containing protein n=1 Tax=Alkaliphilus peptidifermentans DSM 18978 TaxID=1120976 RepID=A0A1G5F5F5_9FIRM|nr:hemerythrin domain-containing protein [Alkaliphilus peptidifermentans]SCY34463.1 Hemerythrin-like domain-containing protein [Alkaliphilus peptidifermentans DSM 18978]
MEKQLNRDIKSVMSEFPEVGIILEEFDIGCTTCGVGICLLKDIISIHDVPKQVEELMMKRIEKAIYPERNIEINIQSEGIPQQQSTKTELIYSRPMKMLVDEHIVIKELLKLIPDVCNYIVHSQSIDRNMMADIIDFIRSYADGFHHAKEEDILFPYANRGVDIIEAMEMDHIEGRGYVASMIKGIKANDKNLLIESLKNYGTLLQEHIKKEDEILYPWLDRILNDEIIDEMNQRFIATDASFDNYNRKYVDVIEKLKNKFA